ncbi:hypothetical protein V9K67_06040 [Paraflavisolibacter sp. H34]|uniref:hypothetical protein n=1 Tax=Huijunlia imazamoxiresistens TaxID=3127457 RepID=UPI00301B2BE0
MNFQEKVHDFVHFLEAAAAYPDDAALQRVVAILKDAKSENELRSKSLINRIWMDCVKSWSTINRISNFLESVT